MMELTMLGTGCAYITECYNTCFVLSEGGSHFLVDGGGGVRLMHQLKHANINWRDIHRIFVTHKHIDHLLGIIWLMRMNCQAMAHGTDPGEAYIYANDEVVGILKDITDRLFEKDETCFIGERLHLVTVEDGDTKEIIGKDVTFFDINSPKVKEFGFTMNIGEGEKLTCCGDEPFEESSRKYAEHSKWLLHESYCLDSEEKIFRAYDKGHVTVKDACMTAESLGVSNLLLYHMEDSDPDHRRERYLAEGSRYFSGNLYIPLDLDRFSL